MCKVGLSKLNNLLLCCTTKWNGFYLKLSDSEEIAMSVLLTKPLKCQC